MMLRLLFVRHTLFGSHEFRFRLQDSTRKTGKESRRDWEGSGTGRESEIGISTTKETRVPGTGKEWEGPLRRYPRVLQVEGVKLGPVHHRFPRTQEMSDPGESRGLTDLLNG